MEKIDSNKILKDLDLDINVLLENHLAKELSFSKDTEAQSIVKEMGEYADKLWTYETVLKKTISDFLRTEWFYEGGSFIKSIAGLLNCEEKDIKYDKKIIQQAVDLYISCIYDGASIQRELDQKATRCALFQDFTKLKEE